MTCAEIRRQAKEDPHTRIRSRQLLTHCQKHRLRSGRVSLPNQLTEIIEPGHQRILRDHLIPGLLCRRRHWRSKRLDLTRNVSFQDLRLIVRVEPVFTVKHFHPASLGLCCPRPLVHCRLEVFEESGEDLLSDNVGLVAEVEAYLLEARHHGRDVNLAVAPLKLVQ